MLRAVQHSRNALALSPVDSWGRPILIFHANDDGGVHDDDKCNANRYIVSVIKIVIWYLTIIERELNDSPQSDSLRWESIPQNQIQV